MLPNAPESSLRLVANILICKGLFGGPDRDRTDDLFHAMEARSQLRHRPTLGEGLLSFSALRSATSMTTLGRGAKARAGFRTESPGLLARIKVLTDLVRDISACAGN